MDAAIQERISASGEGYTQAMQGLIRDSKQVSERRPAPSSMHARGKSF